MNDRAHFAPDDELGERDLGPSDDRDGESRGE